MPVNTAKCNFCPYHIQAEFNRMKPTGRNEFQGNNLRTAFRSGMQSGALSWGPENSRGLALLSHTLYSRILLGGTNLNQPQHNPSEHPAPPAPPRRPALAGGPV